MRPWVLAAVLWMAWSPRAAVAVDDGGTQSPLMVGTGARELGMGRTGVAISQSADALFWNPARLVSLDRPELTLFRSDLYVDGGVYQAGFVTYPTLDLGTMAIGYQRLHVSDIERTDERNRSLGTFDNGESNLLLGYGRALGSFVSVGGALRIAQQSVDASNDVGVGLDLGFAFQQPLGTTQRHRLHLAANLQNLVEPKLRLALDEVADPYSLKLGGAYGGGWPERRLAWVTAFDLDLPSTASPRAGLGFELSYQGMFALRAGVDRSTPTFGVGVAYGNFRLDYALLSDPAMARSDRLSLALHFGPGLVARRRARLDAYQESVSQELERLLRDREQVEIARATAEAESLFATGGFDDALRLYRRILALAPEDEGAARRAVTCEVEIELRDTAQLLTAENATQAVAAYQAILERWPAEERAKKGLAAARSQLQRSADQAQMLRELFKEALSRFTTGDYSGSEATLDELLRLAPNHELGLELRGNVQGERTRRGTRRLEDARQQAAAGNFAAALRDIEEARRDLGVRQDLETLRLTWEKERAVAQAMARQQPRRAEAQREDTSPRLARHRTLTAEQRRELERRYRSGMAAFSNRDFEAAIRDWRSVWIDAPDFEGVGDHLIKAYLFEGVELYGRGKYEEALERCTRVLEIDPANDKARRYLERIQEEKSELEQIGGDR